MGPIDRAGTYRGYAQEWGVAESRNHFPQFNVRLGAAEKWVDTPEEMAAFNITEPGWVAWAEYEQDITGNLVLFGNDKDNPGQLKPLLNYEQVQKAFGWDGASFAALASGDHSKTLILFRVEENEWEGKVSLKVNWVDDKDASPTGTLKALDTDALKNLDAKLAGVLKKAPPPTAAKAPAKPAAATPAATGAKTPPKPAAKTPPGKPAGAAPSAAAPSSATAPATAPTPAPSSKAPPAVKAPAVTAPAAAATPGCTKDAAWEAIMAVKGAKGDEAACEAFVSAAETIGKAEDDFTEEDWGKVRDAGVKTLTT